MNHGSANHDGANHDGANHDGHRGGGPDGADGLPTTVPAWRRVLADFSAGYLRTADSQELDRLTGTQRAAVWLGHAGADEAALTTVEHRLATRLPPSYRAFLATSDGWTTLGGFVTSVRSSRELGWFPDVEPAAWQLFRDAAPRLAETTRRCLVLTFGGDDEFWFLDPGPSSAVRRPVGEWPAFAWSHWSPGMEQRRYPSFAALVADRIREWTSMRGRAGRPVRPEGAAQLTERGRQQALAGRLVEASRSFEAAMDAGSALATYLHALLAAFVRPAQAQEQIRDTVIGDPRIRAGVDPEHLMAELVPLYIRLAHDYGTAHPGWYLRLIHDLLPVPDGAPQQADPGDLAGLVVRAAGAEPPELAESPAFAAQLARARELISVGRDDAAWAVILHALPQWRSDSPYRLAPTVLLTDPAFRTTVTPDRFLTIVATPRGGPPTAPADPAPPADPAEAGGPVGEGDAVEPDTGPGELVRGRYRPHAAAHGSQMRLEQALVRQSLSSPSGAFVLVYQDDGELVLYDNAGGRRLWAAGTVGTRVGECVLQRDGNLVIYESLGRPVWASGTSGLPVDRLVVRDEGDVVLVDVCGQPLWSTDPAPRGGLRPGSWAHGSQLGLEQTLRRQSLSSPSGAFVLAHQDDGDLVLYRSIDGRREWSAGTDGTVTGECVLQRDGNMVIYEATGRPVWASGTADTSVERLVVRDDGSIVLLDDAGAALWSSLRSPRTG